MNNREILDNLITQAECWGGQILLLSGKEFENQIEPQKVAPFSSRLAIDYQNKVIYFHRPRQISNYELGGIIHEMGHVFACLEEPNKTQDESIFFGWQWVVAQKCGMELDDWFDAEYDYHINGLDGKIRALREFEWTEKMAILWRQIHLAKENRLVKCVGPMIEPLVIR